MSEESVAAALATRVERWLTTAVARAPRGRGVPVAIEVREGPPTQAVAVGACVYDAADLHSVARDVTELLMVSAGDRATTKRGAHFALYAMDDSDPPRVVVGPQRVHVHDPDAGDSPALLQTANASQRVVTPASAEAHSQLSLVGDSFLMFADRFNQVSDAATKAIRSSADTVERQIKSIDTSQAFLQRAYDRLEKQFVAVERERDELKLEIPVLRDTIAKLEAMANEAFDQVDALKESLDSPVERAKVQLITELFGGFIGRATGRQRKPEHDDAQ